MGAQIQESLSKIRSVFVTSVGPEGGPKYQFADLVDALSGDTKGW